MYTPTVHDEIEIAMNFRMYMLSILILYTLFITSCHITCVYIKYTHIVHVGDCELAPNVNCGYFKLTENGLYMENYCIIIVTMNLRRKKILMKN